MSGFKLQVRRLAGCIAAGAIPAAAQCAMCRTALAGQHGSAAVFNRAVVILLLPAVVLFSATFLLVYTRHRMGNDEKPEE
jgi:cation transporter-like permease